ncbi:LOW QUALITY PROTEIN: hypothetical protein Cgig2_015511 [Carnegiea gigantea]|uniref:Uncharacterized protein n=1 Tax=Carnegiea gigantea TaxID=171969 RepID=A0A9Q1QJ71_9CARY|nr:LOW QUALITY PROTEIN: hypothetical protein Cgig2_015511 [Carnegiea gigantea]
MGFTTSGTRDMISHGVTFNRMLKKNLTVSVPIQSGLYGSLMRFFSYQFGRIGSPSYPFEMLLRCNENGAQKKRFMFENMWFTEPPCKDIVANAWTSFSDPNTEDNMLIRLNKCSTMDSNFELKRMLLVGVAPLVLSGIGIKRRRSFGGNEHDLTTSSLEIRILDVCISEPT